MNTVIYFLQDQCFSFITFVSSNYGSPSAILYKATRPVTSFCAVSLNHWCMPASVVSFISSHTQPFNSLWSGTTRVGWYQKKHSPTHTHPDHQTSFINFLHLLRSIASSVFSLRAWQSSLTTCLQVLFGLGPSTSYSMHFFTQSSSSFLSTCPCPLFLHYEVNWLAAMTFPYWSNCVQNAMQSFNVIRWQLHTWYITFLLLLLWCRQSNTDH